MDAPAPPPASPVAEAYARRIAELAEAEKAIRGRDDALSRARGIAFLAAVGPGLYGLFAPSSLVWSFAGAAGLVFLVLVYLHAKVATELFDIERRTRFCEQALERAAGTYRTADAYARGDAWVDGEHPYLGDLDVFGPASLFEQLNVTQTPGGAALLAGWLSRPADAETIRQRQRAARELSSQPKLREDLAIAGMRAGTIDRDLTRFVTWTKGAPTMLGRGAVIVIALLFCAATIVLLALPDLVPIGGGRAWLAPAAVQVLILLALRGKADEVLAPVCLKRSPLGQYAEMLALLEEARFEDPDLEALRQQLAPRDEAPASAVLGDLDRLIGYASVRHNALVLVVADLFLVWDLWTAWLVDRWRGRHGAEVERWLDALAELEALISLGAFAHEHPSFAWPELTDEVVFEATALGHPLIPAADRVVNDVAIGGAHCKALMVTGSNMSGKSTMLRAVGVAAVLAQAGAPVCAASLRIGPVDVYTSMRIGDALDRGASRFYVEVAKLKRVVDAVLEQAGPRSLLFLLDEVLHGTNSRERNIGAKAVVRFLVAEGAIGAVSSHDLGLVELEALTEGDVRNVHFEDHLDGDTMAFDYRMKQGPVATSNALRLMRGVGIRVPGLEEA